jgi:metal-responsive CopG/Arc/MetJ family transcriptional regulator
VEVLKMPKRKATFNIEAMLLEEAKEIAKQNYKSLNNFIEQAIKKAIYSEQMRIYDEEMKEAADDPLFLQDIEEVTCDFAKLDSESLRYIK